MVSASSYEDGLKIHRGYNYIKDKFKKLKSKSRRESESDQESKFSTMSTGHG